MTPPAHTAGCTSRSTSPGCQKAHLWAFAQCLTVRNRFCGPTLPYNSHPTGTYLVALISVTTRKAKFSCLCGSRWPSLSKYMGQAELCDHGSHTMDTCTFARDIINTRSGRWHVSCSITRLTYPRILLPNHSHLPKWPEVLLPCSRALDKCRDVHIPTPSIDREFL